MLQKTGDNNQALESEVEYELTSTSKEDSTILRIRREIVIVIDAKDTKML
ncbi:MAG: hypothetical protein WA941_05570 [Nitrososphaeraceae archaeon]